MRQERHVSRALFVYLQKTKNMTDFEKKGNAEKERLFKEMQGEVAAAVTKFYEDLDTLINKVFDYAYGVGYDNGCCSVDTDKKE